MVLPEMFVPAGMDFTPSMFSSPSLLPGAQVFRWCSRSRASRHRCRCRRSGRSAVAGLSVATEPVERFGVQAVLCQSGELSRAHAEVRSADDFEIIGQAGVRDGEVVRGEVRGLRVVVDERRVRIADDLAVAVIFHHDHEHVIEMRNALRYRASFASSGAARRARDMPSAAAFRII